MTPTHRRPHVTRIAITRARVNLGALVKRAYLAQESFILEKSGIPVAALVDIDLFETLLARAPRATAPHAGTARHSRGSRAAAGRSRAPGGARRLR